MLKCAFRYRVLHGMEIVRNCYAWDADARKQINTKGKEKWIYEVVDCTTDARYILVLPQKSGYRAVAVVSHDPQYAALIYNFGYHAIPIDYITLGHAPANIVITTGILYLKIGL